MLRLLARSFDHAGRNRRKKKERPCSTAIAASRKLDCAREVGRKVVGAGFISSRSYSLAPLRYSRHESLRRR
jgi:hypothetical protein